MTPIRVISRKNVQYNGCGICLIQGGRQIDHQSYIDRLCDKDVSEF